VFLAVEHLSFQYGPHPVLEDISFELPRGTTLGLIGPNGAGKSTLLRAMAGVLPVTRGLIRLGKEDLRSLAPRQRARIIAVVPQDTVVNFNFTVQEVVLMGRTPHLGRWQQESKADYEIARQAMEATGTWEYRNRYITELSGGERQLVILARALAQKPQLFLLDEPTAHLDLNHQLLVFNLIGRLNCQQNLTTIAVLHDLNLAAQFCSQLLLLNNGRILALGSPQEVITPKNIEKVYGIKVFVYPHPLLGVPQITPGDYSSGRWPTGNTRPLVCTNYPLASE